MPMRHGFPWCRELDHMETDMDEAQGKFDTVMRGIQKLLKTKSTKMTSSLLVAFSLPIPSPSFPVLLLPLLCYAFPGRCQICTIFILILILLGLSIAVLS